MEALQQQIDELNQRLALLTKKLVKEELIVLPTTATDANLLRATRPYDLTSEALESVELYKDDHSANHAIYASAPRDGPMLHYWIYRVEEPEDGDDVLHAAKIDYDGLDRICCLHASPIKYRKPGIYLIARVIEHKSDDSDDEYDDSRYPPRPEPEDSDDEESDENDGFYLTVIETNDIWKKGEEKKEVMASAENTVFLPKNSHDLTNYQQLMWRIYRLHFDRTAR